MALLWNNKAKMYASTTAWKPPTFVTFKKKSLVCVDILGQGILLKIPIINLTCF